MWQVGNVIKLYTGEEFVIVRIENLTKEKMKRLKLLSRRKLKGKK